MTLPLHGDEIAGLKVSALTLTAISAFIVALAFVVISGAWRSSNDSIQKNGKQQGTDHE
jgi:hypothetical protein